MRSEIVVDAVEPQRFFHIHLPKTGGTTLAHHIHRNFPGQVFPFDQERGEMRVMLIEYLLAVPPATRDRLRAYIGHFPYVVSQLLGQQLVTLTILRHPVDRTISFLKQLQRNDPKYRALSFEEIYEDPIFFPCAIKNYQAKMFAMTVHDRLESCFDVIEVDEHRLALANENLEKVDAIGIQELYGEFLEELADRFGWRIDSIPNQEVSSESGRGSVALRRRIAEDNAADIEFYHHACRVYDQRRAERKRMVL